MATNSFPVLRRGSLNARERLEEAERLLVQAAREAMPKQLVTFLEGKVLEARADVRAEEIEELRDRRSRLRTAEATPADVETMERYMRARSKGFGSRIAPVPDSLDRADAEAVYGKSVEIRKATTLARKLPPGTTFTSAELDRQMREMYEKTQRDLDRSVMGLLGAVDPNLRAADLTPAQRAAAARVAAATPAPKAQKTVAQVSTKRRIKLDE